MSLSRAEPCSMNVFAHTAEQRKLTNCPPRSMNGSSKRRSASRNGGRSNEGWNSLHRREKKKKRLSGKESRGFRKKRPAAWQSRKGPKHKTRRRGARKRRTGRER